MGAAPRRHPIEVVADVARRVASSDTVDRRGRVSRVTEGRVEVRGLHVRHGEMLSIDGFAGPVLAQVIAVTPSGAVAALFDVSEGLGQGDEVHTIDDPPVRVSPSLLGRVIDALGRPLDDKGPIVGERVELRNERPNPLRRSRIEHPLSTGVRVIDVMTPLARGQRMGLFGGSGVGKSTLLGMMARGVDSDLNVVALIGERGREVREMIEDELGPEGMARTVVVVATSDEPAIMRRRAGELAVRLCEYFADAGSDVTLFFDSLTRLAMAERELGLAAGEPPTARGYTPSVFALLPALLERTGPRERGSVTGLFTVLVDGDDMNDPIADSARSILDGHIVLDRRLAHQGRYPAIDPLASISRLAASTSQAEDLEVAAVLRSVLAAVEDVRDLVEVGAYVPGTNPVADMGLLIEGDVKDLLGQRPDDLTPAAEARERARSIVERVG
ncbi:MAG: FliI/YscN family ATPase [Actinomycetia bacterium]|nr:FliI/YscN family ATPase [Actinomycetes bacterium]